MEGGHDAAAHQLHLVRHGFQLVLIDLRPAELVTAMDQIDFGSQLGQIKGFLQRSIAAADDGDRRIAEEVAVA